MQINNIIAKVEARQRITPAEAAVLWHGAPLETLGRLATELKREKSGESVFYNRNFHIEPTNICVFNCRFCSYRREASSPEAWNLTLGQIADIARRYSDSGVTEVHIVGGVHPDHTLEYYLELVRTVKTILPAAVIKAFTAIELAHIIKRAGIPLTEGLRMLKDAGMEAMPGGGAEIFDEEVRMKICPEKGSSAEWLEVHEAAQRLDISTNATMLYGHVENVAHRIDHMNRLRELQDRTGGFNAFIPLKYRNFGNSMSEIGEVSLEEDMRTLAMSRVFLDNFPHVKAYWPMFGKKTTELALGFGADDIDGTIDDTTKIYSMAGAEDLSPSMNVAEIECLIRAAGFTPVERDTFYNPVKKC